MPQGFAVFDETSARLERFLTSRTSQRPGQDARVVVPPRVGRLTIDLSEQDYTTLWIPVTNKFLLAASIAVRSGFATTTWVADLQWSIRADDFEDPITCSPAIQWVAATPGRRNQNIANVPYIRWKTTTPVTGGDPLATILYAVE